MHLTIDDGVPDGLAMDAADHLCVAVHGAGEVRRFAPDGALVATTAYGELSEEERRAHPESGRLFTTRVDVPGLPVPAWRGQVGS